MTIHKQCSNFSLLKWTLATSLGTGIGMGIAIFLTTVLEPLVFAVILGAVLFGASVGIAQWIVFRQIINCSIWWIVANVFGWGLGAAVALGIHDTIFSALFNPDVDYDGPFAGIENLLSFIFACLWSSILKTGL